MGGGIGPDEMRKKSLEIVRKTRKKAQEFVKEQYPTVKEKAEDVVKKARKGQLGK